MFSNVFKEVLTHNGVVSITTWANDTAHVVNTWNSYLQIYDDNKLLIPAAWFNRTQNNIDINNKVIITLGSPNVQGKIGLGTGFVIEGNAIFLSSGKEYDLMKEKFNFLTRVLVIEVTAITQTI